MVHKDSIIKDASPGNNRRCAEEDYDWLHDDTMNPPWRIKAVGAQVKFSHTSSALLSVLLCFSHLSRPIRHRPFVAPHLPHRICRTPFTTPHLSHPIHHTPFVTPHSPHPICHTPFVTPHSSPIAPPCPLLCLFFFFSSTAQMGREAGRLARDGLRHAPPCQGQEGRGGAPHPQGRHQP